MSWRLGGKTASGRGEHGRIEEHGLHVLFGGYHNTFRLMLDVYGRWRRSAGQGRCRSATSSTRSSRAASGSSAMTVSTAGEGGTCSFPINDGVPGRPAPADHRQVVGSLLQILIHCWRGRGRSAGSQRWRCSAVAPAPVGPTRRARANARRTSGNGGRLVSCAGPSSLLAQSFRQRAPGRPGGAAAGAGCAAPAARLRAVCDRLSRSGFPPRIWTLLDLVLATCRGLCRDRVLFRPGRLHSAGPRRIAGVAPT